MGKFADVSVYSNDPSPTTGNGLAILRDNQRAILELPGALPPQYVSILDDALTLTAPASAYLVVDTEGGAAGDNLVVINSVLGPEDILHDGMILHLRAADPARVVTVQNSGPVNGILTLDGRNVQLSPNTWLALQLRTGVWHEVGNVRLEQAASALGQYVTLSGAQTISGAKTFTASPQIVAELPRQILRMNNVEKGVVKNAYREGSIIFCDKNGSSNRIGLLINDIEANTGRVTTRIIAYQFAQGSSAFASVGVTISADGTEKCGTAPTPSANSDTNHIATTAWVRRNALPPGALTASLTTSLTGFLLCNGAAVSRTTYAALFAAIGTKFGAGDGSTTFNLPDLRGRFLQGAASHNAFGTKVEAGLPNITGTFHMKLDGYDPAGLRGLICTGAFYKATATAHSYGWIFPGEVGNYIGINAANSNAIYGKSSTVQPPAVTVNWFIKY